MNAHRQHAPTTTLTWYERWVLARHFHSVLGAAVLLMLAAAALIGLTRLPIFHIHRVVIEGDTHYTQLVGIKRLTMEYLQTNFWRLQPAEAKPIFDELPWVRQAVVRRVFPDTVRVNLEEHQPQAFWGELAGQKYVNGFSEIFEAEHNAALSDLPVFKGEESQAALIMDSYSALQQILLSKDSSIQEIERSKGGLWRIIIEPGVQIELGRGGGTELQQKLAQFFTGLGQIYPDKTPREALQMLASVDLRYQRGFSISERTPSSRIGVEP